MTQTALSRGRVDDAIADRRYHREPMSMMERFGFLHCTMLRDRFDNVIVPPQTVLENIESSYTDYKLGIGELI